MLNPSKDKVLNSLAFAVIFVAVSYLFNHIPEFYYKYVDKTEYYSVVSPVPTDKKTYRECETVVAELHRTSLVDTSAVNTRELVLQIDNNGSIEEVYRTDVKLAINKGSGVIYIPLELPCVIKPGKYQWQSVVTYDVRGIEKNHYWTTEWFTVE